MRPLERLLAGLPADVVGRVLSALPVMRADPDHACLIGEDHRSGEIDPQHLSHVPGRNHADLTTARRHRPARLHAGYVRRAHDRERAAGNYDLSQIHGYLAPGARVTIFAGAIIGVLAAVALLYHLSALRADMPPGRGRDLLWGSGIAAVRPPRRAG